jgi:hypothetical protein
MRLQRGLLVLALGGLLSFAAQAEEQGAPPLPDARQLLGGVVSEDDVGRLFAHLRESLRAAAEGRDPPPMPESLARRLEAAGGELRLRGLDAGLALTRFVEHAVRGAVRELAPPPAARPPH